MAKKRTFSVTSKQLTLILSAIEEQIDAQRDEVRDARPRDRKQAERELDELQDLFVHLTGTEYLSKR